MPQPCTFPAVANRHDPSHGKVHSMAEQQHPLQHAGPVGPASIGAGAGSSHKRGYQACIPCRKRKVRCDLGPVDDPHDPPCVRCRRESKECFFSATRRKRKTDGEEEDAADDDRDIAAHLARRKSARRQGSYEDSYANSQHSRRSIESGSLPPQSPLDPYSQLQNGPYAQSRPYAQSPGNLKMEVSQDQEVTNEAAAALFQSPINTPGDALHLLLKASGQSEELENNEASSQSRAVRQAVPRQGSMGKSPTSGMTLSAVQHVGQTRNSANLDPAIVGYDHGSPTPSREMLSIWTRLRFVRAGWFTAREAMAYID